ncbi:MAG: endonuclease MutS2 [Bacillota bacterium]|jgi:DNA mismatch repair protein MutS2|nr:endonuclease MutS2 [Bacillota bacterium]HHT91009.1 endonuclease MutS2 [Bacillota bacterium]
MNEKSLRLLEWWKVRELVASRTSFSLSREAISALMPRTQLAAVQRDLALTSEGVRLLWKHGDAPFGGASDISQVVTRARLGGVLDPDQLLPVGDFLYCVAQLKKYLRDHEGVLADFEAALVTIPTLRREIERCIDDEGAVRDSASPELSKIRQKMRTLANRIRDRLDSMVHSTAMLKILQEPIITVRNGRYVVPVKAEYRSKFQGIVHDQSGSGATLFMEPSFAVELNNDLNIAQQEEQAEVARILKRLSALVSENASVLLDSLQTVTELDCIFAKARYSRAIDAIEPEMNDEGRILIKQGRHPLLQGDVVPIDVWLGQEFHILVITGPNTGGKTVTLKTVGLLSVMAQAGLHIPADQGSQLAVFDGIYADIGDEQSIEQSLSTFSSHMTTIVAILGDLQQNSLVLLDELGAGTDPTEGAALATAILEYLRTAGIHTIATTHYSDLKSYAYTHDGVENASVEFDLQTLRPTYRLSIGIPGKSNAFAISKRLGLRDDIVQKAQALLSSEHVHVEDMIGQMEANRRQAERDRMAAETLRGEHEALKRRYEQRLQELQEKRAVLLDQAREQAQLLLEQTQTEVNAILGQVRRMGRDELEASVKEMREQIAQKSQSLSKLRKEKPQPEGPANLKPGEAVRIKSLRQQGFVLEKPTSAGDVLIQAGIMKITVKLADVERIEEVKADARRRGGGTTRSHLAKSSSIRHEIDLRGKTVEEGLALVDKYLDDAFLSSLGRVQIIHGKGTGALGEAIQNYVATHPHVQAYRYGAPNEGGHGVTVVDIHVPN